MVSGPPLVTDQHRAQHPSTPSGAFIHTYVRTMYGAKRNHQGTRGPQVFVVSICQPILAPTTASARGTLPVLGFVVAPRQSHLQLLGANELLPRALVGLPGTLGQSGLHLGPQPAA